MGTGQMMITIAAMMLLSTILLRINATFLSTSTALYETKYDVLAVSLGTSIIENATSKAFDEATVVNPVSSVTDLSLILRAETGEVYPNFDDIDDFNNYTMTTANDTTFLSAVFDVGCQLLMTLLFCLQYLMLDAKLITLIKIIPSKFQVRELGIKELTLELQVLLCKIQLDFLQ